MTSNDTVGNRHGSAVISLASDTDYRITRVFDAPAELVFKAFTTPELVKRWWAGEGPEWVVCDIDLRPAGHWRWVFRHGAMEVGFHGDYCEVAPPHRVGQGLDLRRLRRRARPRRQCCNQPRPMVTATERPGWSCRPGKAWSRT
jgi:hypothetical protein